ncbi:CBS domain-containing protein [Deinococcus cavernae]|uniref:CBS domain-containing protein n=1 Tax=Deinococcus cavernae TaxID=2320857 RepID=A0A418VHP8_9DEIO|nr:CBS domain-containing protein [Deinococcus cavernae]RJF75648.1 CBS domain-containing protein [Deinococcus cavernae]
MTEERTRKDSTARFLDAFTEVEKYLKNKHGRGDGRHEDFGSLLVRAEKTDRAIRMYSDDLRVFANLRNLLVHQRFQNEYLAATNEGVTEQLEKIVRTLAQPPEVYSLFRRDVTTVTAETQIGVALTVMAQLELSQMPVYENGVFAGLLTSDTVARWLGANVKEELVVFDVPVRKVLSFRETTEKHSFLARQATVFEAIEAFDVYAKKGERLSAILITHQGRDTEKLLGIITIYDLPEAMKAVGQ